MSALPSPITCFEYDFIPIEVTDRQGRSLDRLKQQAGQPVFVRGFNANNQAGLKATQFVGVFQLDDVTIQVLPKIYRTDNDKAVAAANLLFLLKYAADIPLPTDRSTLQHQRSDFLEVLIGLFATHLRSQWQQGAFRTYRSVEDVLPVLKGQWRLTDQLRRPAQPHQFAVTYDEFTADNSLNRIFRYVVERLWYLTRDSQNRRILGDLKLWMEEVTLLPSVTLAETLALPITRLNQRFEPLLNLARLFLAQQSIQPSQGDCRTYGFTFDMNVLFERFVANLLKRRRDDWPEHLQDCDLRSQVSGRYLATRSDGSNVFQLKPDLAFVSDGDYRLIIDTKYKRLNEADRKLGVSQADMYQMCAYAQRFRCDRILLLYPQTAGNSVPLRESFRVYDSQIHIQVATINLQVNLSERIQQEELFAELKIILDDHHAQKN